MMNYAQYAENRAELIKRLKDDWETISKALEGDKKQYKLGNITLLKNTRALEFELILTVDGLDGHVLRGSKALLIELLEREIAIDSTQKVYDD